MKLGDCLRAYRQKRDIGLRALAAEIGTSHATLARIESGHPCDQGTLVRVLIWLFTPEAQ